MNSALVYSTLHGRMCPECAHPVGQCVCSKMKPVPKGDGVVRVGRETMGRRGKCVTLVTGVPLDSEGLLQMAKRFKQRCGTGGTVKDGIIEIQGDHRDTLVGELTMVGYTVRKSGG